MKHYKFCMQYSHYSNDEEVKRLGGMHPQKAMKELGITYTNATPQSMGDQWWFWNCENLPDEIPPFLTKLGITPYDAIGFGLSAEEADDIEGYKSNEK